MLKKMLLGVALCVGALSLAQARELPDFTALVEKESRAVVNISTTQTVRNQQASPFGLDPDDPVNELLRRFGATPRQQQQPREFQAQSLGSGFIIEGDGYIITNAHVIAQADTIKVKFADKKELKAKVIGSDARTDVALLKVEATGLPTVDLGDASKLKVGEWVVAIGSPFGFESTVTAGIVSAKGRALPDENYVPFIQTDAAVNPGNSGGPLFNMSGQVVGVNSQIYSGTGGFMGISFAIPIDVALDVAKQLKSSGKVSRGRLGVGIQAVSEELAKDFGLSSAIGALLSSIEPDSPAAKGGLKAGDIVLKYDGKQVASASDLPKLVANSKPESKVKIQVWRDRTTKEFDVAVGEMEQLDKASQRREYRGRRDEPVNRFGLRVQEVDPRQLRQLGLKYGLQVRVAEGAASRAGLQPGDIIVGLGPDELTSYKQLEKTLTQLKPGQSLAMRVIRGEAALFLSLRLPLDDKKDQDDE